LNAPQISFGTSFGFQNLPTKISVEVNFFKVVHVTKFVHFEQVGPTNGDTAAGVPTRRGERPHVAAWNPGW
jgi:hypothetical protein